MVVCRHCGEPVEPVPDWALGPAWTHVGDGRTWEWCRVTVAEPGGRCACGALLTWTPETGPIYPTETGDPA